MTKVQSWRWGQVEPDIVVDDPGLLLTTADELIDGQYADRPHLRPIADQIVEVACSLGEVTVQARRTHIALVGPRRMFAQIAAVTPDRVDLGLRLDAAQPRGRLVDARDMGSGVLSVRFALTSVDEIDDEVRAYLRRAYLEHSA